MHLVRSTLLPWLMQPPTQVWTNLVGRLDSRSGGGGGGTRPGKGTGVKGATSSVLHTFP